MKKTILLFTLICVGQVYGMNELLPVKDIHGIIIEKALATSNTPNEAIKTIHQLAAFQGIKYDNTDLAATLVKMFPTYSKMEIMRLLALKDFTKRVHKEAEKLNTTPRDVAFAEKINTFLAQEYLKLSLDLTTAIGKTENINIQEIISLIEHGADVNFYSTGRMPALLYAIHDGITFNKKNTLEIIKLLLKAGANPHFKDTKGQTALDIAQFPRFDKKENINEIRIILKEAMQKY